jgi:uncharacterized protein (UPF0212 family)
MSAHVCQDLVKEFHFVPKHESLLAVLLDHNLAALGDAYVNFVYSLALSEKQCKPTGKKVDSSFLAAAIRKVGLRAKLPSRTDRHKQADAAEALIVYAWLMDIVSFNEAIQIIVKEDNLEEAFSFLLKTIVEKLKIEKA